MVGIGVGPGDPEMITVKALKELAKVDHIFAPTIDIGQMGRAEEVVRELFPNRHIERIVFQMAPGAHGNNLRIQAASNAALDISKALAPNDSAAFVTLGDPALYSTFYPLAVALKELLSDVEISMIPGIPAFTYLASSAQMDLLDNSERLFIVPVVRDSDFIRLQELLLDKDATVVIYKCAGRFPLVRQALEKTNRLSTAIVGEQLGTKFETIANASAFGNKHLSYFATVISPALRS